MARFDVHEMEEGPLVVVCQSALLDHLDVRFAMPLVAPQLAPAAAGRLNPVIDVNGKELIAFPQWSSGIPVVALGRKIANVDAQSLTILGAFDFLISGF
ncbi:MAG: CcdB family protein [Sphingomicrobium sp.]